MSSKYPEEFKVDDKDYLVLVNEADRNYYFADDKTAIKPDINKKLKFTQTKEEFVEFVARQFLKGRQK